MVGTESHNPYAPPTSELNAGLAASHGVELASRGTRLAAASLDGLLIAVPMLPTMGFAAWQVFKMQMTVRDAGVVGHRPLPQPSTGEITTVVVAVAISFLLALAVAIYQWVLIARTGQSLGKKWLGVRIEKVDGGPVTFGSAVVVRSWVFRIIGAVPYLGWLLSFIDLVCIFREDRRCLHDHLAGTRVVRVER